MNRRRRRQHDPEPEPESGKVEGGHASKALNGRRDAAVVSGRGVSVHSVVVVVIVIVVVVVQPLRESNGWPPSLLFRKKILAQWKNL